MTRKKRRNRMAEREVMKDDKSHVGGSSWWKDSCCKT